MIRRFRFPALLVVASMLIALGLVSSDSAVTARGDGPGDVIPGRYIVVVNEGYAPSQVAADHAALPLHVYTVAARGFAARLSQAKVDALLADPRVNNVVPDRVVSLLCHKPQHSCNGGGGTTTSSQVLPAGVKRVGADQVWGTTTGNGVGVAVVDTGLDFNHTDLSVAASCFTAFTSCQDDHGHGTHVGGTIAARNNTQGVVGVAPNATLYAVKVLDQNGSGTWSGVIAGVDWVTQNAGTLGIRVANMSLGGSGSNSANCGDPNLDGVIDDPLHKAICNSVAAGVTYVVAAGNSASGEISQSVPAAYPEVMAIASTTAVDGSNACKSFSGSITADTASYFTTDGVGVSISAPGEEKENINRACFINTVGILSTKLGGGTTRMSGTSMAAPHVTGVVALVLQAHPSFSPANVRTKIESSADRVGTAPLNSPTSSYTFDGVREGIVWAPGATGP